MGGKRRIDVMLSSTFRELEQHRSAVIDAMNHLQLTPLAQEFDAATDADLIQSSLDKVEKADVYVGLIGLRYGQRPICPVRNPDRLSLTELEYRRAVELGMPRLMFVSGPEHRWPQSYADLSKAEGDESFRLQQAFVERIRADRVAAEFVSPGGLAGKSQYVIRCTAEKAGRGPDAAGRCGAGAEAAAEPRRFSANGAARVPLRAQALCGEAGFRGRATELALIDQMGHRS